MVSHAKLALAPVIFLATSIAHAGDMPASSQQQMANPPATTAQPANASGAESTPPKAPRKKSREVERILREGPPDFGGDPAILRAGRSNFNHRERK